MIAATLEPQHYLVLGAILLIIFTLMRRAWIVRHRQLNAQTPIRRELGDRSTSKAEIRLEELVDRLEVRLHDTFREMNARIDTKMHVLNELIVEAEDRIRLLKKLGEQTGQIEIDSNARPASASSSRQGQAPAPNSPAPPDDPLVIEMDRSVVRGPEIRSLLAEKNLANTEEKTWERRREEIYRWADEGLSPIEIGRKTDCTVGEVQMVLGLRKRNS